jgi:hypothetical protein
VDGLIGGETRSRRSPRPWEPVGTTRSSSRRSRHTSPTGCTSTSPRVSGGSVCPSRSSPREKRAGPSGPPAEPAGRRGPPPSRRETRRRRPHPPSATAAAAQLVERALHLREDRLVGTVDVVAEARATHGPYRESRTRRRARRRLLAACGSGDPDPPTDIAAFLGDIAPARSSASCAGEEWGFAFRSNLATTELAAPLRGYAQIGRTRNGVFL